ncbi:MAG: acetoacetate decarboxylase family protein [Leptolyngbyaceae cyanobacterium CSU_1_4]|nr:acetoacetate decarboxylase family protein [Leptolyngbyaceae cyanobacterium CSU_1_4]
MTYPQPPWSLKGRGFLSLYSVELERVRSLIPQPLQIFSFFPGKTLGGVYVGTYGDGSTLRYNEFIAVPALTFHQGQIGAWISHIYVDHSDSMAGGAIALGVTQGNGAV